VEAIVLDQIYYIVPKKLLEILRSNGFCLEVDGMNGRLSGCLGDVASLAKLPFPASHRRLRTQPQKIPGRI